MHPLQNLTDGIKKALKSLEANRETMEFGAYLDFKLDLERLVYSLAIKYHQDLGPDFDKAAFVEDCGFTYYDEFASYDFG